MSKKTFGLICVLFGTGFILMAMFGKSPITDRFSVFVFGFSLLMLANTTIDDEASDKKINEINKKLDSIIQDLESNTKEKQFIDNTDLAKALSEAKLYKDCNIITEEEFLEKEKEIRIMLEDRNYVPRTVQLPEDNKELENNTREE